MTDEQKTTQEQPRAHHGEGCCAGMMEQMMGQRGRGRGCMEMMSQMMAMFGGVHGETEEKAATEATQQA